MKPVVIGDATLYLADCMDVLPTLGKVDCVITDPPYGINLQDNSKGGRYGRSRPAWEYSIVGDETPAVGNALLEWCEINNLPTIAFASPRLPWAGNWSSMLVWDKGPAVGGGGDVKRCWKQSWELIQVARCGILNGQRDESVLKFWAMPSLSEQHPAAKPVPLMVYLIEKTTSYQQIILDPFLGSGNTGVAAIQLGRKFVGIEREPKYFKIACDRIEQAVAQGQLFPVERAKQVQESFL